MKKFIGAMIALTLISACSYFRLLTSATLIAPNEQFVLGNNEHQSFRVNLDNPSRATLDIHLAPIGGGRHSAQKVQPGEQVNVNVAANTALIIGNPSDKKIEVKLKVYKETNLSMSYEPKN